MGLLLERTGPEGSGEHPVLCRSQLDTVGVLAVALVSGLMAFGMVVQFLQGGCR